MNQEFLKIVVIIAILAFLIYYFMMPKNSSMYLLEGLENPITTTTPTIDPAVSGQALTQNIASGAQLYSDEIKKLYTKMKDDFHFENYRANYENVIIQLDDYISALMLQKIMSVDKTALTEANIISLMSKLNILQEGKISLNTVMKFIDGV